MERIFKRSDNSEYVSTELQSYPGIAAIVPDFELKKDRKLQRNGKKVLIMQWAHSKKLSSRLTEKYLQNCMKST